jgi:histidine ammonia-lyase
MKQEKHFRGIELLCGGQAVEFRGSKNPGRRTKMAYLIIRKTVPMPKEDRVLSNHLNHAND